MAIYIYRCAKCGEEFERMEHISEHGSTKPKCPKCGTDEVRQVISPVFAKTSKKS